MDELQPFPEYPSTCQPSGLTDTQQSYLKRGLEIADSILQNLKQREYLPVTCSARADDQGPQVELEHVSLDSVLDSLSLGLKNLMGDDDLKLVSTACEALMVVYSAGNMFQLIQAMSEESGTEGPISEESRDLWDKVFTTRDEGSYTWQPFASLPFVIAALDNIRSEDDDQDPSVEKTCTTSSVGEDGGSKAHHCTSCNINDDVSSDAHTLTVPIINEGLCKTLKAAGDIFEFHHWRLVRP